MRLTLCAINSKYIHSSLAVWYLHASVKQKCDCTVIEGTINEKIEVLADRIIKTCPEIVAFSTYIWNKTVVARLAKEIKNRTGAAVLLGGPEVSYNADEIFKEYPFVDYVISGEGEMPLAKLCDGITIDEIEGLCYKKAEEVVVKPPFVAENDPPNPYSTEYFESLNGRIAYLETSRGCPFRCAFCLSGRCGGVRFFDVEEAKNNIVALANSGTQTVKFIDRTFNADRKRARSIFEFIISEYRKRIPEGVCFHFEIEGELLDDETFDVLEKAPVGLIQFEIGLQSFNEKTLDAINRKTNLKLLCKNIKKVLELGNIHTHIDLIIGLPYENFDSFRNSFNLAYELKSHMLQVGFLKLLHGSELRENQNGKSTFTDTPPYEILSNEWLDRKDVERLHAFEDVFEKLYNSRRFALTCEYLCNVFQTPFDMFMSFADFVSNKEYDTLDKLTLLVYECFGGILGVDKNKLRDALAIDRLATNRMGALPEFLKVKHPRLKKTLNALEMNESTKRPNNVKRAATVLLTESKVAYVDYINCNYLTNRFLVKLTDICDN